MKKTKRQSYQLTEKDKQRLEKADEWISKNKFNPHEPSSNEKEKVIEILKLNPRHTKG